MVSNGYSIVSREILAKQPWEKYVVDYQENVIAKYMAEKD